MRRLDMALNWPQDTAWGLVALDRSDWSEAVLEDEETGLMDRVDEADQFGYVVTTRLRAIPEGAERDAVMRQILAVLGVQP